MTTINQELYEALKEASASDDAAKRTAASVYDKDQLVSKTDLAVLDRHLAVLEAWLGMIRAGALGYRHRRDRPRRARLRAAGVSRIGLQP
jgi:hypothetical protein